MDIEEKIIKNFSFNNKFIGDDESAKKHTENMAVNATSMIPGPAGWAAGGARVRLGGSRRRAGGRARAGAPVVRRAGDAARAGEEERGGVRRRAQGGGQVAARCDHRPCRRRPWFHGRLSAQL